MSGLKMCSEGYGEEWVPVPSLPALQVNAAGQVRRAHNRQVAVLRSHLGRFGYPLVATTIARKRRTLSVHALVCEAFHGPRLGRQVDHINEKRDDNRAENLRWLSAADNVRRRRTMKLSRADVEQIKASTEMGTVLAARFGVTKSNICHIRRGASWRDVQVAQ